MRTNLIGVVVALAVAASACSQGGGSFEPTGPSEVIGKSVPPTVVATVSPKIYDSNGNEMQSVVSGSKLEYTVKVGQDFRFRQNVFNPQAMGRHVHYEVQAMGLDLASSRDGDNRDFDEPQLPSSVGAVGSYRFYMTGDRTWRFVNSVEIGGNLPQPTVLAAEVIVHVVP